MSARSSVVVVVVVVVKVSSLFGPTEPLQLLRGRRGRLRGACSVRGRQLVPQHRHRLLPRPVPGHAVQVDRLPVGHHVLVPRVVNVTVRLVAGLRLLHRGPVRRRSQRVPVLVARYARLVRVLALHALRVHVAVLAARHAVHADRLLLERAVVVLETPRDAAVRVVVPVPSQHLQRVESIAARNDKRNKIKKQISLKVFIAMIAKMYAHIYI